MANSAMLSQWLHRSHSTDKVSSARASNILLLLYRALNQTASCNRKSDHGRGRCCPPRWPAGSRGPHPGLPGYEEEPQQRTHSKPGRSAPSLPLARCQIDPQVPVYPVRDAQLLSLTLCRARYTQISGLAFVSCVGLELARTAQQLDSFLHVRISSLSCSALAALHVRLHPHSAHVLWIQAHGQELLMTLT